jgi:hypothetical protein
VPRLIPQVPRPSLRARTPLFAVALLGAVTMTFGAGTAWAATDDPAAVAWTVQTVDNANGAQRPNFSYSVDPGATIHDALLVTNTGTTALPLAVYAADAFTTASGNLDLLAADVASTDAGLWISVETRDIVLQPGQYAEVPFTITVPADASPGDHSGGIVSSLVTADDTQALSIDRRLGSRVNLRVSGELAPAATVERATFTYAPALNPFAPGTLIVDYTLTNTGNTRVTALQNLTAAGPFGILAAAPAAEQLPEVTRGSAIEVHREIPMPSIGWIDGTLVVTPEGVGIGAGGVAAIDVPFGMIAVPWTLFALLAIVAVLAILTVVWARRRASRDEVPAP